MPQLKYQEHRASYGREAIAQGVFPVHNTQAAAQGTGSSLAMVRADTHQSLFSSPQLWGRRQILHHPVCTIMTDTIMTLDGPGGWRVTQIAATGLLVWQLVIAQLHLVSATSLSHQQCDIVLTWTLAMPDHPFCKVCLFPQSTLQMPKTG